MQFRDSVYPPGACKGGSGGCLTDNLYYNHFLSRVLKTPWGKALLPRWGVPCDGGQCSLEMAAAGEVLAAFFAGRMVGLVVSGEGRRFVAVVRWWSGD